MKLEGQTLTTGMEGNVVSRLHQELTQLGCVIAPEDLNGRSFGPTTRQAVEDFQRTHGLAPTGNVDEATAAALTEAIALLPLPEHDQVLARLRSARRDVQPGMLSDEEVAALASRTGLKQERIEFLRGAAQLSEETGLPADIFYGLARQGLPVKLSELLALDADRLASAVEAVVESDLVAGSLRDQTGQILARLRQLRIERTPLAEAANAARVELPGAVAAFLEERNIRTLGDIQNAGGLSHLAGLPPVADSTVFEKLEACARLAGVSPDLKALDNLIARGYTSSTAIASTPRSVFVTATCDDLGEDGATQIHARASAQSAFLNSVLAGCRAELASGFFPSMPANVSAVLPAPRTCEDWESAVGPQAYLVDLVNYATSHVKKSVNGLRGEYYQDTVLFPDTHFFKLIRVRTDPKVDFSWGTGSPDFLRPDFFSVRWTGQIEPLGGGTVLATETDDGVRLWVDERSAIDDWTVHPPRTIEAGFSIEPGKKYRIKMEYFEAMGGATARFLWRDQEHPNLEPVPQGQLRCEEDISPELLDELFHQPFSKLPVSCLVTQKQVPQVRLCIEVLRSYLT